MKCESSPLWQHAIEVTGRVYQVFRDQANPEEGPDTVAEEVLATAVKVPSRIAISIEPGENELQLLYETRGLINRLESGLMLGERVGRLDMINDLLFECKLLHDAVNERIAALGGETRPAWHDDDN